MNPRMPVNIFLIIDFFFVARWPEEAAAGFGPGREGGGVAVAVAVVAEPAPTVAEPVRARSTPGDSSGALAGDRGGDGDDASLAFAARAAASAKKCVEDCREGASAVEGAAGAVAARRRFGNEAARTPDEDARPEPCPCPEPKPAATSKSADKSPRWPRVAAPAASLAARLAPTRWDQSGVPGAAGGGDLAAAAAVSFGPPPPRAIPAATRYPRSGVGGGGDAAAAVAAAVGVVIAVAASGEEDDELDGGGT